MRSYRRCGSCVCRRIVCKDGGGECDAETEEEEPLLL